MLKQPMFAKNNGGKTSLHGNINKYATTLSLYIYLFPKLNVEIYIYSQYFHIHINLKHTHPLYLLEAIHLFKYTIYIIQTLQPMK